MDTLPVSSLHGIFQAKVLEWVAISFSRGSSRPRYRTRVFCTAGRFFTNSATREALRETPLQMKIALINANVSSTHYIREQRMLRQQPLQPPQLCTRTWTALSLGSEMGRGAAASTKDPPGRPAPWPWASPRVPCPSGEPGVSGDFWGSQEGCQGPSRHEGEPTHVLAVQFWGDNEQDSGRPQ